MHAVTDRHNAHYAWLVFILATGFVLYQYLLQFSQGILTNQLMRSFHIGAIGTSLLAASYYLAYVIMQIPAGLVVSVLGARKTLSLSAVITLAACLIFYATHFFWLAVLGRFLMGFGMSCAFVCALFLFRNWFSGKVFTLLVGILESAVLLGTVFCQSYAANVATHVGWRHFILICALIALSFAILNPLLIRNAPEKYFKIRALTKIKPTKHFLRDVQSLTFNFRNWANGLFCGFMLTPQMVFVALWGVPFLEVAHNFTLKQSAFSTSMIFLGTAVASPLFGFLFPHIKSPRYFLSMMAFIASMLFGFIILNLHLSYDALCVLFFFLGVVTSVYLWNYTLIHELEPKAAASTNIGYTNAIAIGSAPVLQYLLSLWLNHLKDRQFPQNIQMHSAHDYQTVLLILPLLCLFAALLILFCKYKTVVRYLRPMKKPLFRTVIYKDLPQNRD